MPPVEGQPRLGPPPAIDGGYGTILADPPWLFANRTGKVAPKHKRLRRDATMRLEDIEALPVADLAAPRSHLYLWAPNPILPLGFEVTAAWGFTYKATLVWEKIRQDGGPDGRGVGFYFRNVNEPCCLGCRARTPARSRRAAGTPMLSWTENASTRVNPTSSTRS